VPVLQTGARDAISDALDAYVNTGAGTATFKLETSGDVEVASFDLQNPAFGASSSGVITLAGVPLQDTSAAGGTVAQASLYNRNATKVLEAVAATSGQEVTVSSTTVGVGETVTLTALTVTTPTGP
jgi:hypothetical protein